MATMTRVRQHGTEETVTDNALDRINAVKRIVERKQYAKIDGMMVDLYSASIVSQVYDKLSDVNKAKYASCSIYRMLEIAYALV